MNGIFVRFMTILSVLLSQTFNFRRDTLAYRGYKPGMLVKISKSRNFDPKSLIWWKPRFSESVFLSDKVY